jgi:putative heme iron utilization protein
MSLGGTARRHLRAHHNGVLSTISRALEGYPFGSVTPFVLDAQACPVILVSRLAEHTKNINADPRLSLLVHARSEAGVDMQAQARVTLMGKACAIGHAGDISERYFRYFPAARDYLALDFDFYRIDPVTLRVVAGFGKIHWISREAYWPPANTLAEHESEIIALLNHDHAQQLRDYCRLHQQRAVQAATLIGIDCDGFDVRADTEILRFAFENCVTDAVQARDAFAEMAAKARAL